MEHLYLAAHIQKMSADVSEVPMWQSAWCWPTAANDERTRTLLPQAANNPIKASNRKQTYREHKETMKQHGYNTAFWFFKVVFDQELQDAIAEIEHAVPGGSFLPSVPMQDEGKSRVAQQLPGHGCVSYRRGNSHATDECMSQPERVLSLSVLNVPLCTAHYLTQACSFGIMSPHHWW